MKKTAEQLEIERYVDDAIDEMYIKITNEIKKDFAIKLVETIVFSFCGAILLGFVGFLFFTIGWSK